jgi:tRNA threonylcarbamoyladenosine biosynthesis protein TsaE
MRNEFVTTDFKQTQKLGELLSRELRGGEVVCLSGDLGAGKTTFTQGLLKGLGAKGPYTSPTFVIMKKYGEHIFHIDAYRVGADDILNLGWKEIIADKNNIVIIEWAERVSDIIPKDSLWVNFEWKGEKERKIMFNNSPNKRLNNKIKK